MLKPLAFATLLLPICGAAAQAFPIRPAQPQPCAADQSAYLIRVLAENKDSSPTPVQPVLNAIAQQGNRIALCATPVANDIYHQDDFWLGDGSHYVIQTVGSALILLRQLPNVPAVAAAASAADACLAEVRARILASANALAPALRVTAMENLKATGKTVKSTYGEELAEYQAGQLESDDSIVPNSTALAYALKDGGSCTVIRLTVHLR